MRQSTTTLGGDASSTTTAEDALRDRLREGPEEAVAGAGEGLLEFRAQ